MKILKYRINYATADTRQALLHMTLPLLAALVLNMTYSLVDSLWIGNLLGKAAMAALTSSTAVILLLNCLIVGMTNGIAILLAQAIGANDEKAVGRIQTTSLLLSFVLMLLVVGLCEMGVVPLLKLLHTPVETFSLSCWYLRIYLIGVLPSYFYMYFTAILRCYGNTLFQMAAIATCSVLNAVMDPLFMRPFGFNGVAVATVVTQTMSLLAALAYLAGKPYFRVSRKNLSWNTAGAILVKGVPSVIQQSIPAISTMALTTLVSGFGLTAIAAFGIIGKMENILLYPVMALNMGLTTIVGQCIGSGRPDRMRDYVRCGIRYGGTAMLILAAAVIFFSRNLSLLFLPDSSVSGIVRDYFFIAGLGYVIHAVTTSFLAGLNGMGKTTASMLLYVLYFLCVRVPLAYVLTGVFHLGLRGIWSAFLVSHFVAVCTAMILYRFERNKLGKPSAV